MLAWPNERSGSAIFSMRDEWHPCDIHQAMVLTTDSELRPVVSQGSSVVCDLTGHIVNRQAVRHVGWLLTIVRHQQTVKKRTSRFRVSKAVPDPV